MPFHFLENRANILTNPILIPLPRYQNIKVCAVKIERVEKESTSSSAAH